MGKKIAVQNTKSVISAATGSLKGVITYAYVNGDVELIDCRLPETQNRQLGKAKDFEGASALAKAWWAAAGYEVIDDTAEA